MTGMAKKLLPRNLDVVVCPEEGLLYYTGEQNDIRKMQISTGKGERIGTVPPRLSISDVNLQRKEILWRELLYPSKLVLVKDVFE